MKMTSAYANKVLRKLNDDKDYWRNKEQEGSFYVAASDEEPVVPEYNYSEVTAIIEEIDEKIVTIKHAINLANVNNAITVGDRVMTVDRVLVRMTQLNRRKATLDNMRKQQPKMRMGTTMYSARKTAPEYRYINYDMDTVKADYERIEKEVAEMQMALDKYNQTVEFDVEI